jgi:hypothetical protein
MKALVESGLDDDLAVLECLAAWTTPNHNHRMLAALARRGVVVLTTNFDDLIEQAYRELPGAPPLHVAVFDEDFPDGAPEPADGPALWKLHGSFVRAGADTRSSLQATMTRVLALTQTGRRYRFLASVLAAMDVLVVGYSGWGDFDVVPVIARTASPYRLTWTMHEESDGFRLRDSGEDELDAAWETDVVGLDRVLLNVDGDGRPVRAPEHVRQLFGRTRECSNGCAPSAGLTSASPPCRRRRTGSGSASRKRPTPSSRIGPRASRLRSRAATRSCNPPSSFGSRPVTRGRSRGGCTQARGSS